MAMTIMRQSLILASYVTVAVANERLESSLSNYEIVGEGLIFESEPPLGADRRRILEEIHGGNIWDEEFLDGGEDSAVGLSELFDSEVLPEEILETSDLSSDHSQPIARKLRRVTTPGNRAKKAMKDASRDDSVRLLKPFITKERILQECATGEKYFKIEISTDNYGFENSWTLKTVEGDLVQKGPPDNSNYADNTRYIGGFCVSSGDYVFTVHDKFKDGMCCGTGSGSYSVELDGVKLFSSPEGDEDWEIREHFFVIETEGDTRIIDETSGESDDFDWDADYEDEGDYDENFDEFDDYGGFIKQRSSTRGCQSVKIQFKTDRYGKETSAYLKKSGSSRPILSSVNQVGAYQTKTLSKCVPPGTYTVTFKDNDGLCCRNGQGWYKVSIRGTELVGGGYFIGSASHTIKVGYNYLGKMNSREKQYLASHNSRRRKHHRNAGKSYRALRWSSSLAGQASSYARKLLGTCSSSGIKHAHGVIDGENLAKNKGKGSWGKLYPVENIVSRWVERESGWSYPKNAHLTQAIWRATGYLGCGESSKRMSNGDTCRFQVCRYTRAGNCNVKGGNWRAEAFKDVTSCGRPCPSEGCYA